jgi:predicted transposase/invertase (TIGR01784 family)
MICGVAVGKDEIREKDMKTDEPSLLKPISDVVFKQLMTQGKHILKSFLTAALDLGADDLSSLNIDDPHISAGYQDAKTVVLDVRAKTEAGKEIGIEIQLVKHSGFVNRIVFYLCSLFAHQIRQGDNYVHLKRAISIIITGFCFTEEESFVNYYTLRNDKTFTQLSDIIQICTLELPKLKVTDTGALSDWMRFLAFDDEDDLKELDELATKDTGIREAVEMLKYLSKDETLRNLEMSHQKFEWDMASRMADARDEGDYEGTLRVARAALLKGLDINTICDITGLDTETIKSLQED